MFCLHSYARLKWIIWPNTKSSLNPYFDFKQFCSLVTFNYVVATLPALPYDSMS